jgi:hypothetical protein
VLNCVDSCRYKGANLDFSKSMPPQEAQEFYNVSHIFLQHRAFSIQRRDCAGGSQTHS